MKASRYDEVKTFEDGELIFAEGDEGHDMLVVQSGEVVVSKKAGNQEITLAVLGRGSFFGEMSLLESLPRSATVRAKGETRLLVIRSGSLLLKIRRDPTFAFEMLQQMSRRLRDLGDRLVDALTRERTLEETNRAKLVAAAPEYEAPEPKSKHGGQA